MGSALVQGCRGLLGLGAVAGRCLQVEEVLLLLALAWRAGAWQAVPLVLVLLG